LSVKRGDSQLPSEDVPKPEYRLKQQLLRFPANENLIGLAKPARYVHWRFAVDPKDT
jgi:hypothetical protein